jgi:hypothetical protein
MGLKDSVLTISGKKEKIQKIPFLGAEKVPSFERILLFAVFCTHNGGGGGEVFEDVKTVVS